MEGRRVGWRALFDSVARSYDQFRPRYPRALVEELVRSTSLGPGSRVLELGCGTGQLTEPLAEQGVTLVAVEMGGRLADLAQEHLQRFPGVEVVRTTFEDWPLSREPFDLVVAATAWQWLDPIVRLPKALSALRPGGFLALLDTHHVDGGDGQFFRDSQKCYAAWDPEDRADHRLPSPEHFPRSMDELDDAPLLGEVRLTRYEWEASYSSAEYSGLLGTFSDTLALHPDSRRGLLECLSGLIDRQYSGRIRKRYLFELRTAMKSKSPADPPEGNA